MAKKKPEAKPQITKEIHLVAEMPSEIVEFIENGGDEEAYDINDGFSATLNHGEHTHYFILCLANLPVKDYTGDLGFGLWVEVFKADYEKFLEVQDDDAAYATFACTGTLANDWPLFDQTLEDEVQIKVLDPELKPQIVAIESSNDELSKYIEEGSLDDNAKNHLRTRLQKLVE